MKKYKLYILDLMTEFDDNIQFVIIARNKEELSQEIAKRDYNNFFFSRSIILKIHEVKVKNQKLIRKIKNEIL